MTEKDPDRKRKNKPVAKPSISRVPDFDLWEMYTKDLEKLPDKAGDRLFEAVADSDTSAAQTKPARRRKILYARLGGEAGLLVAPPAPPLRAVARDMDKRSQTKLKRGEFPIDGTLDLHGLSEARAHHRLIEFLLTHHQRQSRCLLIITGQGRNTATGRAEGALRRNLPRWCQEAPVAPFILSVEQAQTKHGGNGAFYVLLRRKRPDV